MATCADAFGAIAIKHNPANAATAANLSPRIKFTSLSSVGIFLEQLIVEVSHQRVCAIGHTSQFGTKSTTYLAPLRRCGHRLRVSACRRSREEIGFCEILNVRSGPG